MEDEWHEVPVSDLAELSGGFAFKSGDYSPTGRFVLRTLNIRDDCSISREDAVYIPEALARSYDRFELEPGDTLFVMVGATLGKVGYVREKDLPALLNQNMWLIRAKRDTSDSRFVHYAFRQAVKASLGWASGSARDFVRRDDFRKLLIPAPSLPEQQAIGNILGTLDDKIELNRRMNETLEAMARALFKSWFVDFDPVRAKAEGRDTGLPQPIADLFPDSLDDSELGEIPKGWEVSDIGAVADVIDCLHSKKPERRKSGLPLLQLSNIRDDGLIDLQHSYLIDEADYRKWVSRIEASPGDCVITNVGRVGAVAQMPANQKAALGRNMTALRCKPAFPFPTVLIECLMSQAMKDEVVLKMDSGTILDALNVRNIPRLRFVRPRTLEILDSFERIARPLRAQMERTLATSRTLGEARDTLLPKLLSAALRIPDSKRLVDDPA